MATLLSKAARNEQRKLTATYLNNVAIAILIAGVTVPLRICPSIARRRCSLLSSVRDH